MASEMKIVLLICLLAICMAAVDRVAGIEYSRGSCSRFDYRSNECLLCCRNYQRNPAKPLFGSSCVCKETEASQAARKKAEALAKKKAKYQKVYQKLEDKHRRMEQQS